MNILPRDAQDYRRGPLLGDRGVGDAVLPNTASAGQGELLGDDVRPHVGSARLKLSGSICRPAELATALLQLLDELVERALLKTVNFHIWWCASGSGVPNELDYYRA